MGLDSIVSLLQTTLLLLQVVAAHPELPQSSRDNAVILAQQTLSQIRIELSSSKGTYINRTDGLPIDVFVIAGADNAVGFGNASQSPAVTNDAVLQFSDGKITPANDPVGNASTGSSWPAFGITYNQKTGHRILLVPSAVANSHVSDQNNSSALRWSDGGLIMNAFVNTNSAIDALKKSGYNPTLAGIIWAEGEYEGSAINSSALSAEKYKDDLSHTIQSFRETFNSAIPFYILATGNEIGADDAGFAAVRIVQNSLEDPSNNVHIISREPVPFPATGLQTSGIHYTQSGYTHIGVAAADNVARILKGEMTHTQKKEGLYSINPAGERALTFLGFLNESNSCDTSTYTFWYGDGSYADLEVPKGACGPHVFAVTHTFEQPGTYSQRLDSGSASTTGRVIQSNVYTIR